MRRSTRLFASVSLRVAVAVILFGITLSISVLAQKSASEQAAKSLQQKIDAIKAAEAKGDGRSPETITVSEEELRSYVLLEMRDEIPARIDSLNVHLTEGAVAADTRLTFGPDSTGNVLVDVLISGTHDLFVKGKLAASSRRGRFELQEVKVDGIPVPKILIESLIAKYVNPEYPDVDIDKDFEMPWGIDALTIAPGKATIVY
jgi:hypothetical protein